MPATTVTTVPHQQTSSAIIVISPLRSVSQSRSPSLSHSHRVGRGGGAEDTGEAGTGTIMLMVSTISLRGPSVVQYSAGEGGEAIMLSASICRGEEAEMAGTPGHWHQSSADGDGDTSITRCHVTGDE